MNSVIAAYDRLCEATLEYKRQLALDGVDFDIDLESSLKEWIEAPKLVFHPSLFGYVDCELNGIVVETLSNEYIAVHPNWQDAMRNKHTGL